MIFILCRHTLGLSLDLKPLNDGYALEDQIKAYGNKTYLHNANSITGTHMDIRPLVKVGNAKIFMGNCFY